MKVGYLSSWRTWSDEQLAKLDFDIYLIAFAGIHDGEVVIAPEVSELMKRLPNVGISLGGWNYRHQFKPEQFPRLVRSLAKLNVEHIDIDWEFDSLDEAVRMKDPYRHFVTELSRYKRVSCAITLSQLFLVQDLKLEFVTLMAYDLSGPWSQTADHYAPYAAVKRILPLDSKYLLGVSMSKVTFYGCKQPGDPYDRCEIEPWSDEPAAELHWDAQIGSSYGCHDGNLVYQEDEVSLAEKYRLAMADGLGGITIWDANPTK